LWDKGFLGFGWILSKILIISTGYMLEASRRFLKYLRMFEHNTLGELGKIVLIKIREGRMVIQAELYKGQDTVEAPLLQKKKQVFEQIVATVDNCFNENFG
jgi:hypothetical protein